MEKSYKFITIRIDDFFFAVAYQDFIAALQLSDLQSISPEYIRYKGKVIRVIKVTGSLFTRKKNVILLNAAGYQLALFIDEIIENVCFSKKDIFPLPPAIDNTIKTELIWGIAQLQERLYFLL